MRQKNVIWVVVLVIAVVVAAIAVFAVVRKNDHIDNHQGHNENQTVMIEEGHHHEKNSSDHDEESSNMEPSGVLKDGRRVVKIEAQQFEFDPNRIVVNKGEIVRLEVTSQDVTHGMNIEEYGIDRKLQPGKTEIITFTPKETGRFHFHCSVYCGKGHSDMHGELIVREK